MARAFGDFQYKKNEDKTQLEQAVSCLPDVHSFERSNKVLQEKNGSFKFS